MFAVRSIGDRLGSCTMKNTCILIVTKDGLEPKTMLSVMALQCPNLIVLDGCSNLCKARSEAFDVVLSSAAPHFDTILCVDDDMVFEISDATRIIEHSRRLNEPVSACAVTGDARPAAVAYKDKTLTGLAFMAIPVERLRNAQMKLLPLRSGSRTITPWCLTGERPELPGVWLGEDYWFCLHFGGVQLDSNTRVGHIKPQVLYP